MRIAFSILLLLCLGAYTAPAQRTTLSEEEIKVQELFLDAMREKLLENWGKAAEKFREVLEKDKDNHAASFELAIVCEALKDSDKAINAAKNASNWDPANKWYKIYLAELYQKNNLDAAAAAVYEQLATAEPNNQEYHFQWAYFLVKAGQPQAAIKVYDNLEKKMGVNEELARHKHSLYTGIGDYKKAARELEKLSEKFPDRLAYLHLLATFYEQVDEREKAVDTYRKILQRDPQDARARIALADQNRGTDNLAFLNALKSVFENPSVDIDTKIKEILPLVNQLADTGNRHLGTSLLGLTTILERQHPGNAKAHAILADVLFHTGEFDKALEQYKKTLELDDSVWSVWEQVLYLLAIKQQWAELATRSENALDLFPNQAWAQYFNGLAYTRMDRHQDALSALQQALLMCGKNTALRYQVLDELGVAYFQLKQYERADAAFEEALQINPKGTSAMANFSYCLAARPRAGSEQLEKAKSLALQLNALAPDVALHEDALAFALYKLKDYATAQQWINKAMQHGGEASARILEHCGDILYQLGQPTEALQYWQKARQNGGKSASLDKKIAEGKPLE
jgi:tetratricopeptide (TPR) repeat protein